MSGGALSTTLAGPAAAPAAVDAAGVYARPPGLSKPARRPALRLRVGALLALVLGCLLPVRAAGQDAGGEEGRPAIGLITLDGNRTFSDGELKALMRTREPRLLQFTGHPRYVRDWLRSDLATLEAFYHRAGFYEVSVSSLREGDIVYDPEQGSVDISIHVDEGKRRYLRALSITPYLGEAERGLRRRLAAQPGQPFDPEAPAMDHFRILRALQEQGHFAGRVEHAITVVPTASHASRDSVDLEYRVDQGPPALLAGQRLEGNTLDDALIQRELTLKVGGPLKLDAILTSKQNLLDSGYFRAVDYRLEPVDSTAGPRREGEEEALRLVWIFRERKMATVETGVGLGSVDGLRLLGGWTHRNLLDLGQRVSLQANFSLKDDRDGRFGFSYERESLDWRFLDIVRLRARLGLTLFREKDYESESGAFSLETRAIRLSAARRVDPVTVMRLRQQFDFLYQRRIVDLPLAEYQPTYNTRSISLILDRDTRDHFFNPSRGGHSWSSYELAGGVQGGDHSFQRLQLNLTRHRRLSGEGIVASRIFLGGVWPYGKSRTEQLAGVPADGVPFQERFYCGGGATVRGYDENSLGPRINPEDSDLTPEVPGQSLPDYILGGRYMLVANLEWRFPLSLFGRSSFGGVLFFDGGGDWESLEDIAIARALPWQAGERNDTRRVFYGLGAGLRYLTPITVIRVDFGLPLQNLTDKGGRWHLSLGHTF